MRSHVPNKGEQMVRYYGYDSNVTRRKRKKQNQVNGYHASWSRKDHPRNIKNWARLIQEIYEVDPRQGQMRIIAFIEDDEVIKKVLKHLGLWEVKAPFPTFNSMIRSLRFFPNPLLP